MLNMQPNMITLMCVCIQFWWLSVFVHTGGVVEQTHYNAKKEHSKGEVIVKTHAQIRWHAAHVFVLSMQYNVLLMLVYRCVPWVCVCVHMLACKRARAVVGPWV